MQHDIVAVDVVVDVVADVVVDERSLQKGHVEHNRSHHQKASLQKMDVQKDAVVVVVAAGDLPY